MRTRKTNGQWGWAASRRLRRRYSLEALIVNEFTGLKTTFNPKGFDYKIDNLSGSIWVHNLGMDIKGFDVDLRVLARGALGRSGRPSMVHLRSPLSARSLVRRSVRASCCLPTLWFLPAQTPKHVTAQCLNPWLRSRTEPVPNRGPRARLLL